MEKVIKHFRLNVSTAKVRISIKKDIEKRRTGEKSKNIFVRIVKNILPLILDFIV